MREEIDRIQTPTSGLFLKQAGWQNWKNARNVHSGSLSNLILQNTHSITSPSKNGSGHNWKQLCSLVPSKEVQPFSLSSPCENATEGHQSSSIAPGKGRVITVQDPHISNPDLPRLAPSGGFFPQQKKDPQHEDAILQCTAWIQTLLQATGSTSVVLYLEATCQFLQNGLDKSKSKEPFAWTSRNLLSGDKTTSLLKSPALSLSGSPHIRNSCNLDSESQLFGQVKTTAQKEPVWHRDHSFWELSQERSPWSILRYSFAKPPQVLVTCSCLPLVHCCVNIALWEKPECCAVLSGLGCTCHGPVTLTS